MTRSVNSRRRTQRAVAAALFTGTFAVGLAAPAQAGPIHHRHHASVRTTSVAAPSDVVAPATSGDASDEWPITECGTVDGKGCAPDSKRVDLVRPTFSNPTNITNPLFPAKGLHVLQLGKVEGKPFRSETTTLPSTGVVDWYGRRIPVVMSQYTAYLDGRIEEVAIDRYAQADDGSVWYFGEDVIDYQAGAAFLNEGTWLAGRDAPPAMLMPAHPKLGDVYRVENVIGIVFEELTVKQVNQTLTGPNGPVHGAIVVDELGVDGGHSEKTLAPGYGEFLTTNATELEAMAVATPVNARSGGAPAAIRKMLTAAGGTLEYARSEDWKTTAASVRRIQAQFDLLPPKSQPPRILDRFETSMRQLHAAVAAKNIRKTEQRGLDVAQSIVDLEARYLAPDLVEVARFHLHAQQLRVDAAAGDVAGATGDVAVLEWISARIGSTLDATERTQITDDLRDLRAATDAKNLPAAADHATRLASLLRDLTATP